MKPFVRALAVLLVLAATTVALTVYVIASSGLSTRTTPSVIEESVALTLRQLATPRSVRKQANPVQPTEPVIEAALQHFADHCASCHANDGSGNMQLGRSFYPPAPDMRALRTQSLTDGEIFSIIENGIRLTGMPAWGTGTDEGARESWALVHFIRRLPQLSEDDIERMGTLNPVSPEKLRESDEAQRFLEGASDPHPATRPAKPHHD